MNALDFYFDQTGFQNIIRCGTVNYFDGWVFSHDKHNPVSRIVFRVGEDELASLAIKKDRPDLEKVYHQTLLGFNGVVDIPEKYFGKVLTTYAETEKKDKLFLREFPLSLKLSVDEIDFRKKNQLPDDLLMHLVVHNVNPQTFLEEGKRGVETIIRILAENNIELEKLHSILDFGTGCGRVIRWWQEHSKGNRFFGTDINPLLIDWCKTNLGFADFSVNGLHPPMNFKDEQFDFLYAFSVFTHLRIETQLEWLKEFYRVIAPEKYILLSVHGDYHAKMLAPEVYAEYLKNEYYVLSQNAEGENLCATYQSKDFSEKHFAQYFAVVGYYPQALNACGNQDLFLLRSKKKK